MNRTSNTNATKVQAFAHGDRIELHSFDLTQPGSQIPVLAGSCRRQRLGAHHVHLRQPHQFPGHHCLRLRTFTVFESPDPGSYLLLTVTKTNGGSPVTVGATNSAGNTSISALTQTLVNLINATPALQGSDGVAAEDFIGNDANVPPAAQFNLRALSAGWNAAQLQARLYWFIAIHLPAFRHPAARSEPARPATAQPPLPNRRRNQPPI